MREETPTDEVHPIPWVGEGTVPDVPRHDEHRNGSLLRFAAGTAAVALAVGVGGGLAARSLRQHEAPPPVTSSTTGQEVAQAPAQAPAPAPHAEDHEESD